MSQSELTKNRSLLVIDDHEAIHRDFRKILCAQSSARIDELEAELLGDATAARAAHAPFEIDSAMQGEEGYRKLVAARDAGNPYSVAFVDMRMPPGWDGVETIARLWSADPHLQVVICTAHSDYSWREIVERLGETDQLLILKKPFDEIEVRQLALALVEKSHAAMQARLKMDDMERIAAERTNALKKEIVERERAQKLLHEKEEQLRQAQKLEAIGLLAGGIAHEFNNLLQVISGYTHFAIQASGEGTSVHDDLQHVAGAAERAAGLTAQLLTFSRLQILQQRPVDPNRIVRDLVEALRRMLPDEIEVVAESGRVELPIHADPDKLKQALLNLCFNARDAMPRGGRLTIRTSRTILGPESCDGLGGAKPGTYALIAVTDTGKGIPPEIEEKIFEPFFTTKEVGTATGLGLSVAYGIVRQHGGAIGVETRPEVGSTFSVYIPVCGDVAPADRLPAEAAGSLPGSRRIVLVVSEGEPAAREFVDRTLVGAGYTVHATSDCQEALRFFESRRDRIAVVILDMVMPQQSVHPLLTAFRQLRGDVAAIICSGYDFVMNRTGVANRAGVRLLTKPYHPWDLLQAVRESIEDCPVQRNEARESAGGLAQLAASRP